MAKHSLGSLISSISVTHQFDKEELIFLNTSDVLGGKILIDDFMDISLLKGQAKKTIQNEDILFSEIRPKNKHYAYVDVANPEDYVVSTKLMVLRNKSTEVLTRYIYYFLTYEGTLDYLQMRAENRIGSFPQITFDHVKILELDVPGLDKQADIVKVLSDIDQMVDNNRKIISTIDSLISKIYSYWFVQYDFPNDLSMPYKVNGGELTYNDALKEFIPVGWTVVDLADIANITMGQSPPGDSYNEEGHGMIFFQGSTDFGERHPIVRQFTTSPTRFAKAGDILLSVRAPVGTSNIAKDDCCIGRGLAALCSKDGFDTFLVSVIQNLKQQFDIRNSGGTTFGSITKDDLFSLKVIQPSMDVLSKFHELTAPLFIKQNYLDSQNQELLKLRSFITPKLLTGQVLVS